MIGDQTLINYMLKLPLYNMLFTMLLILVFDRLKEPYYRTIIYAVLAQIPITILSTYILSSRWINPIMLFQSRETLMQFLLSGISIVFYTSLNVFKQSRTK